MQEKARLYHLVMMFHSKCYILHLHFNVPKYILATTSLFTIDLNLIELTIELKLL